MRLATSLYAASFGSRPGAAASAPGRLNLLGEHTEYNGGVVLPIALERRTAVAVAPARDWAVVSQLDRIPLEIDVPQALRGDWTDYLVGVVRELEAIGAAPLGARVAVASTLPVGAGLSSSAALTVAAARALSQLAGRRLAPAQLLEIAYRAEHDQLGVRRGRMDQTIAALGMRGTALLVELGVGTVVRLPFPGRLWVVETGVSHPPPGDELINQRRRECEEALAFCREWRLGLPHLAQLAPGDLEEVERRLPPPLIPRVRYVVTETARTRAAASALAAGDLPGIGRLMVQGHESLRVDYQYSVPEADLIVQSAVAHGACGARLSGAGWGGAVTVLAPEERAARIMAEVGRDYADRFGRVPDMWSSRAAAGVRREALPAMVG
ncbi:MAG TPA: galactokinase family protein [Gemmatimonadales bacterium]|nr:galactokinase family protein [Gemmatimonadales bacterium]